MAKTKIEVDLIIKGSDSVAQVEQKTKSLRSELFKMKELLASGVLNADQFSELSQEAAALQDRIGDVNKEIKLLSSDSKKLDSIISLTQGIVGGFAAVQGITALAGEENEDLQKTMVKLQGAMAALNGLQAVAATLNKSSAFSTNLLSFAQARYTMVVGGTTGALKVLRIVGATLGIGLIIAAIGLLVVNFEKVKKVVDRFIPSLKLLGDIISNVWQKMTDYVGITSDATRELERFIDVNKRMQSDQEKEIDLLKARGATAKEVYDAEKKLINTKIAQLIYLKQVNGEYTKDEQKQWDDLLHEKEVLIAAHGKTLADETKKRNDELKKLNEQAQAKELADLEKFLADSAAAYEKGKATNLDFLEQNLYAQDELNSLNELNQTLKQDERDAKEAEYLAGKRAYLAGIEKQERDRQEKEEKELTDAKLAIRTNYFNAANSLGEALVGEGFKQTAAGKAIALSQIATDTAVAISSLVKNSQANPANAPTGGIAGAVQFAAGIAQITANIANARKILVGGGTPSAGGGSAAPSVGNSQPPPIRGFIPDRENLKKGDTRVFVLEKDITDKQGVVARVKTNATLV